MSPQKFLILISLVCCSIIVTAQTNKNQTTTSRILKTAGTLLEAQQFEAAEEYYKKALNNATAAKSAYFQAQAYEGLGHLYGKTKQQNQAVSCYQKSIKLYRSIGMTVIADVLHGQMKSVMGIGDLYAGVEIGAKGIKLSVIDVKMTNGENDYTLKLDTAINTDAVALSYQSEKETFDAITVLYGIIKQRFDIATNRIHIVISSGLKQELDKYNKVEYFAAVVRPKELDPLIKIRYVTVEEEAQLSFKGIVPQVSRLTANQLDVGSGNTKGGYLNASRSFIPVTFPLGTKSFQRLVESKAQGSQGIEEYKKAAEKIFTDSLGRMVVYQLRDKKDFRSRDIVYLSGGIVWSIASLMHPESIRQNHVELTKKDIAAFRNLVYSNYDQLTTPDLAQLKDDDAVASQANINRVLNTYDQKALLAGSILLEELLQQVNTDKFIFPRYAYVGWISGYIIDKISKQYTEVAAK